MGYVKGAIVKIKGIALHHIKLNQEMKTITINGQIIAHRGERAVFLLFILLEKHVAQNG